MMATFESLAMSRNSSVCSTEASGSIVIVVAPVVTYQNGETSRIDVIRVDSCGRVVSRVQYGAHASSGAGGGGGPSSAA